MTDNERKSTFIREAFPIARDEMVRHLSAGFPGRDAVFAFSPTAINEYWTEITFFRDEEAEVYAVLGYDVGS